MLKKLEESLRGVVSHAHLNPTAEETIRKYAMDLSRLKFLASFMLDKLRLHHIKYTYKMMCIFFAGPTAVFSHFIQLYNMWPF